MAEDATVTAAEISRIAGVGRAAVSNWRRRYADFPKPVGGTTTSPAFSLPEVEDWLRGQKKLDEVPREERLWQRIRSSSEEINLAEVMGDVSLLLLLLHDAPAKWPSLASRHRISELPRAVFKAAARHKVPPSRMSVDDPARADLLREVGNFAIENGVTNTFEFLLGKFLEANSRRVFVTPKPVAELMARLAMSVHGRGEVILDPACGSGNLLTAAIDQGAGTVLGMELDDDMARLVAVRLAMTGQSERVWCCDSLTDESLGRHSVDAVVCHPPFGQSDWGHEELAYAKQWDFGVPPRSEPELAWIENALWQVRPGGLVAMLMPPAAASRRAGRRIRSELLRRDALHAVIALPAGEVPGTALGLHLWLLCKPESGSDRSRVLMVDTTGMDIDDAAALALQAWHSFMTGGTERPPGSTTVRTIDMLDETVNYTPARWLTPSIDADDNADELFLESKDKLTSVASELTALLAKVTAEPAVGMPLPMISLAELARSGALQILSGRNAPTKPGDLVIRVRAGAIDAQDVTEAGVVPGSNWTVLRPDPAVLDHRFLASFLLDRTNRRYSAGSSGPQRIDVRAVHIPRLPLSEQRRIGDLLGHVQELEQRLSEGVLLSKELAGHVVAGLVGGTLQVRV